MPSPLSVDPRERVVAFVSGGASCREAACRFGVSAASVSRWSARLRRDGQVTPRPMGGRPRVAPGGSTGRVDPDGLPTQAHHLPARVARPVC
ncbi:Transposase (plasmid) [Roseomonas mucosa]|nr:MAG: hypothetical protein DI550_23410 [Escherichia coli]QDD97056.1 Transposase [Roseomonas mucosa]